MRRSLTAAAGLRPAKLLLALTLFASLEGCEANTPYDPFGVRQVAITVPSDSLRPGQIFEATAISFNGAGDVVDAPVRWQSLTPSRMTVDADGIVRALAPGIGVLRATSGSAAIQRQIQLVNPPVAAIVTSEDSLTLPLPGSSVQLWATPVDSIGLVIVGAPITWSSDAPRIAAVATASGNVTPVAVGNTTVRVLVDGLARDIAVRVEPALSASAPVITSITPSLIGPGTPFTIRGSRLRQTPSGTEVLVDGRPAQLLSVSDSLIRAILNEASLPCLPSAEVSVQVSAVGGVGAASARLQLAPQLSPEAGEALILASAGDIRCVELPGEGRYLVSILNTARAIGAGSVNVSFTAQSGALSPPSIEAPPAAGMSSGDAAHLAVMEASRRALPTRSTSMAMPALQVAPQGGLGALRVPNLDASNICTSFRAITARTVYSGSRVFIVEDTATRLGDTPLLAGAMDAEIQSLGAEIDNLLWPIITRFGNPLVMDSRLDDNGRVVIALTPELNAMQGGEVLGAVVTCDFFSRAQLASSNVGEMLYLQVPTLESGIDASTAIAHWRHAIRGTVAHELKHVVSFGERIVRNLPLEEVWLEEATAQHAQELFTRALTGATADGDTPYSAIRCEILAARGDGACAGTPALMRPSFDGLWDFLSSPSTLSPLGATSGGDFSFYGSGWSLLRWAMDHSGTSEASFTQQLTLSSQSGVANFEARAGRSWDQMLARWSLALATDGRTGVAPLDATLRFPSWNLGSVFSGLCGDLGTCSGGLGGDARYTRAHPVQIAAPTGDFVLNILELAPAGFQLVEIAPSSTGARRFVRLSGLGGAPPPATARLAILRLN